MVMGYSRSGSSLVVDVGGAYVDVCSVIGSSLNCHFLPGKSFCVCYISR